MSHPLILTKIDPEKTTSSIKLPGLVDVLDADIQQRVVLQQKVTDLAATVANNDATQAQRVSTLETAVKENDTTHTEQSESLRAELQKHIEEFKDEFGRETKEARDRLALLERSLWRKFVDWFKRAVHA